MNAVEEAYAGRWHSGGMSGDGDRSGDVVSAPESGRAK